MLVDCTKAMHVLNQSRLEGQYGPALALIGAGFIGCNTVAAVVLLTLAVGLSGASYSGFQVNIVYFILFFSYC